MRATCCKASTRCRPTSSPSASGTAKSRAPFVGDPGEAAPLPQLPRPASPPTCSPTPTAPEDLLVDDGAAALVSDLGACLREIDLHGRFFGECSFSVVLWDDDRTRWRGASPTCLKVFATHDATLVEERANLLNAWLATLPGGSATNLRYLYLLNTNYADLSFLFSLHRGAARTPTSAASTWPILETTHRTPFYLNLHHQDVAHTVVLGRHGQREVVPPELPADARPEVRPLHGHLRSRAAATAA